MIKVCCDFCERAMEVEDNNIKLFKTKEIDTRKLYPHLCEECANKIDDAVRFDRSKRVTKRELAARMAKINEERRKRLNSNG